MLIAQNGWFIDLESELNLAAKVAYEIQTGELEKANVAKGGLYHHFNSKKDLVIAIINERICPNSLKKYASLDEIEGNKLNALLDILESRNENFDKGCPLGNLILELSNIDDDILANVSLQCCKNANKLL